MLFTYAAITKSLEYSVFKTQLNSLHVVGMFASTLAWGIPLVQLVIAGMLVWPATRLWGLYSAALLLVIFSVYILYMLAAVNDLPCACAGVFRFISWTDQLELNMLFLFIALIGIQIQKGNIQDKRILL